MYVGYCQGIRFMINGEFIEEEIEEDEK